MRQENRIRQEFPARREPVPLYLCAWVGLSAGLKGSIQGDGLVFLGFCAYILNRRLDPNPNRGFIVFGISFGVGRAIRIFNSSVSSAVEEPSQMNGYSR